MCVVKSKKNAGAARNDTEEGGIDKTRKLSLSGHSFL